MNIGIILTSRRTIIFFLFLILAQFVKAQILVCDNGTLLFKEDFGGNCRESATLGDALSEDVISLPFSQHQWLQLKNGYDIRKTAWKRSGGSSPNHVYSGWYADFGDHTHEDDLSRGYFLTVDLDYMEATFYKVRVDGFCEETLLNFSFWGHPVNASESAPITLTIEDTNGNVLNQEKFIIDHKNNAWQRFVLPFLVPKGETSIVYKVFSGAG